VGKVVPQEALVRTVEFEGQACKGAVDIVDLPCCENSAVYKWTSKAPRAFRNSFSFRACRRGRLLALPLVKVQGGGTFRIRLVEAVPAVHITNSSDQEDVDCAVQSGVSLLEAQLAHGFAIHRENTHQTK